MGQRRREVKGSGGELEELASAATALTERSGRPDHAETASGEQQVNQTSLRGERPVSAPDTAVRQERGAWTSCRPTVRCPTPNSSFRVRFEQRQQVADRPGVRRRAI